MRRKQVKIFLIAIIIILSIGLLKSSLKMEEWKKGLNEPKIDLINWRR